MSKIIKIKRIKMFSFKSSHINSRKILIITSFLKYNIGVHTSCSVNGHGQVVKTMKKVLGNNLKKKRMYFQEAVASPANTFSKVPLGNTCINPRRAVLLNKLFMRNVTDVMSSRECAALIVGLGVEINKVKITHDYKILKVYWTAITTNLEVVKEKLHKCAGLLRHELSALRLMGQVPLIKFVKDKTFIILAELDKRLSIADYGEEGPSNIDPAAHLMSEFELVLPIEKNLKEKLAKLEEQNPWEIEESQSIQLSPMTHCVFDLDHEAIMNRIKQAGTKTRYNTNITGDEQWANFKLNQYSNTDPLVLGNAKLQREAFNKFLQQRQVLRMKEVKISKEDDLDFVDIKEQGYELKSTHYENTEDDFIVEDIDENNVK